MVLCLILTGCYVIYNAIWSLHIRHKVHKGTEFGNYLLSCVVHCMFLLLSKSNALRCSHINHNVHKGTELCNSLL